MKVRLFLFVSIMICASCAQATDYAQYKPESIQKAIHQFNTFTGATTFALGLLAPNPTVKAALCASSAIALGGIALNKKNSTR